MLIELKIPARIPTEWRVRMKVAQRAVAKALWLWNSFNSCHTELATILCTSFVTFLLCYIRSPADYAAIQISVGALWEVFFSTFVD